MRKTTVVALPLLLVLLAFAFAREEAPPVSRAYQSMSERVVLNFAINKINFEEVELVLIGEEEEPEGSNPEGAPRVLHKQHEEDVFFQFEISLNLSLAKGLSTVVTMAGVSDETEVDGDVMPDNLPDFPFLRDGQGQPVLNFPFAHEIVHNKDGNGDPYMHMTYVGTTVPLISTLVVAEPMTMPSVMSDFFDMHEHMQFQPGAYERDPQTQGFWIPMRLVELTNLSLNKTCDASDDGTGSFHVTVTNDGPSDATGVVAQDNLPGGIEITNVASDGAFNTATGVWTIGEIGVGHTASLWIDFTFEDQGLYTNTAEVTALDQLDEDSSDDADECGFFVFEDRVVPDFVPEQSPGGITDRGNRFSADVAITKDVDLETAAAGNVVTYTIMAENKGPHSTAKVQVTDHLPACLTFVSAEADRGAYDPDTWIWDIGALKVGEKVTLTITAMVGTACDERITNTARVSRSTLPDPSSAFNLFDVPNPAVANNSADAFFDITANAPRTLDGTTFALGANYPNPFNPTTTVPFSLAEAGPVSIKVYDLLGREVAVLVEGAMAAGVHEVTFDAGALSTGVYLIRMDAAGTVQTQYVTLTK